MGLAIWYMDDGHKHSSSNAYYLHTEGFRLNDVLKLQDVLLKNFNIKSTIQKKSIHDKEKSQYLIYTMSESGDLFKSIIDEYVCESMKYKLHIKTVK